MTDIEYRVADLINFSSNQKPIDFEQAYRDVITAKVSDAIEAKKAEIAQAMFTSQNEVAYDDDDDQDQDESKEDKHA